MNRVIGIAGNLVSRSSRAANRVGLALLVLMALITLADVIGRSVFNKPISGAYEITELTFIIMIALMLGYSAIVQVHVRIDIVVTHFPRKAQIVIDAISHLLMVAFFLVLSWRVCVHSIATESKGLVSGVLSIPIFPFEIVLALGCLLIGAMYLVHFLRIFFRNG